MTEPTKPQTVTLPRQPEARAFIDVRLRGGGVIENYMQAADPDELRGLYLDLAGRGFIVLAENPTDGPDGWKIRVELAGVRFRDESKGIVTPPKPVIVT